MKNKILLAATFTIIFLSFVSFNINTITGYTLRNVGYSVFQGITHKDILEEQRSTDVTTITSSGYTRRGHTFTVYVTPGISGSRSYMELRKQPSNKLVRQYPLCENNRCYNTNGNGRVVDIGMPKSIYPGSYTIQVFDYRINDYVTHTFTIR